MNECGVVVVKDRLATKLASAISSGLAIIVLASTVSAQPIESWKFEAFGGFSQLHIGDFPDPGYDALLTQSPGRHHQDMGAFHWSNLANPSPPSRLGINEKEPITAGDSWKAPGQYYTEKKPIRPGITSTHGNPIDEIQTDNNMGQVIGWVTHYNNVISGDFGEAGDSRVGVNYHLRLFDPVTNTLAWDSGEMFFLIEVYETRNIVPGCCPDGNDCGTAPNDMGCADRFRVGVLIDIEKDGIDAGDLSDAEVGSCFVERVGKFTYASPPSGAGQEYEVFLTGFWENNEDGEPVLTGEGWSPEYQFTHFEVRALVRVVEDQTVTGQSASLSPASCNN